MLLLYNETIGKLTKIRTSLGYYYGISRFGVPMGVIVDGRVAVWESNIWVVKRVTICIVGLQLLRLK
jgi:hypothetical protein